jgi:cyclopropane fatty-acyl-phospholipid synthase-like methyltransferase
MQKPFAPSCERNQQVIFEVLRMQINTNDKNLLEIGSGTGQHAVFMANKLPNIQWYTADLLENHLGIQMWIDDAQLDNINSPIEYQAGLSSFPQVDADIIYTANTLHIMSWDNVKALIQQLGDSLKPNAKIIIYGPFNYKGEYTSESNAEFDIWLKKEGDHRAIRDFEKVVQQMQLANINLVDDIIMPANNRILIFNKN